MLRLAIPIAPQRLVMNTLNAVDVLIVGKSGETAVAAVGLAGQVFFLMTLFCSVSAATPQSSPPVRERGDLAQVRRMFGLA